MCPICWISGFIAVLFGESFIATVNHPISWALGFALIIYSIFKFYEAKKRGKKMTEATKKRNKRIIFRFVQGAIVGSIVTIIVMFTSFFVVIRNLQNWKKHICPAFLCFLIFVVPFAMIEAYPMGAVRHRMIITLLMLPVFSCVLPINIISFEDKQ